MKERPAKYYMLLILSMFFWGGSWPSAKILVTISPSPLTIGFLRFLTASVLFLIAMAFLEPSPRELVKRENLKVLCLAGLTGVFGYGVLFLSGMTLTTAAQGSIIAGFNPVTVSLFAHLMHNERLRRRWQYTGFALSFTGVVFVVGVQSLIDFNLNHLIGNVIVLGAMMMWGLYSSISKEGMKEMSSLTVTAGGVVYGCIFFGLGALIEEPWLILPQVDLVFWINILYLGGLVTFTGFFFYFESINKLGATRAAGFISLVPVFGTVLSVLILQDPIYWTFGLGLLLVVIGIIMINFPRNDDVVLNQFETGTEES
jgi:drug/metabolite transporter (DMT)-like permease